MRQVFDTCGHKKGPEQYHRSRPYLSLTVGRRENRKRRDRDSNPGYQSPGITVFETAPFSHSGISPKICRAIILKKPRIRNVFLPQENNILIYLPARRKRSIQEDLTRYILIILKA
jgi:hypothetical protein